jgi:hypothetical protein
LPRRYVLRGQLNAAHWVRVAIAARRTPCAVTLAWEELGPAALTVSRAFRMRSSGMTNRSEASNCSPTVKSFPVCADPTWTLYKGKANYFCCLANEVGILPARNAGRVGLCVASDMSLAMTQSATKVRPLPLAYNVNGPLVLTID